MTGMLLGWRQLDAEAPSAGDAAEPSTASPVQAVPVGRPLLCLSDIHGDLAGLESVLRAVKHLELAGVVACGDHCLGGPQPFLVWRRLQELGATMVRGPSDLALGTLPLPERRPRTAREGARVLAFLRTRDALGDIVCRRLAELPTTAVVSLDDHQGVMVMHGSPDDEYRGLLDDDGLADRTGCVAEDVLVSGSTHVPFARRLDHLLVVNAGSVGQSGVRSASGGRTAHAVLLQSFDDGRVRAWGKDIPIEERYQQGHAERSTKRVRRSGERG